jgi:hypothetical protein
MGHPDRHRAGQVVERPPWQRKFPEPSVWSGAFLALERIISGLHPGRAPDSYTLVPPKMSGAFFLCSA